MFEKFPRFVTTITPQRISFAGGGTDFPDFFLRHGGAVVSATINQFAYVTVKRHSKIFREQYRLSYSITEHVNEIDLIENDIARECLRLLNVDPPLFVSTASDLPLSSGLGSSSSFAVGLLLALHTLRGESVTAGQLAEEACHVEIDVLGKPIGKQDQYAVAFGGLNYYEFRKDGRVRVESLWHSQSSALSVFDSSLLFWTGIERRAEDILSEQKSNIPKRIDSLVKMTELAYRCRMSFLTSENLVLDLAEIVNESWGQKRNFATTVSSEFLDDAVSRAIGAGALGSKLVGAGGGGFLYVLANKSEQEKIGQALFDMSPVNFGYCPSGARVLVSV